MVILARAYAVLLRAVRSTRALGMDDSFQNDADVGWGRCANCPYGGSFFISGLGMTLESADLYEAPVVEVA